MAELPRYRRDSLLGVVVSEAPSAALREGARAAETFSESLNRVSRFAFNIAETQAKIEGAEYGAVNAPTAKQLEIAKSSGQDLEGLLPGDQFTVFGSQARSAALDVLTTNMEREARESITALSSAYSNETITLSDLQAGLMTIEDQYSTLLQDISPAAAVKFRANVSLAGNSAFLSASKTEASRIKADQESVIIGLVTQEIAAIPDIVNAGQTVNDVGEVVTTDLHIATLKSKIVAAGQQLNDAAFVRTNLASVDSAVREARMATVVSSVRFNPQIGIEALQGRRQLPETEAQQILEGMNPAEKNELFDKLQSEIAEKLSAEDRAESNVAKQLAKKADETIVAMTNARIEGDMDSVRDYLNQLSVYDSDKFASYSEAILLDGGADDDDTVENLALLATNLNLTESDVNKARADGKISLKTYVSYLGKVKAGRDETYRNAIGFIKRQIGYPDTPLSNPGPIERQALQEVNEIVDQLFLKRQEVPDEDALNFVKPLLQDIKTRRRDAKARSRASTAFRRASNQFPGQTSAALLSKYKAMPESPINKDIIEGLELYIEIEGDLQ